jgi:hypothetical protein
MKRSSENRSLHCQSFHFEIWRYKLFSFISKYEYLQSPSWSLIDDSGFSIFSYSRHHGLSLMTQDLHYLKQFPFILPGLQHLQTLAITLSNTCGTRYAFPYGAPNFIPGFWWGQYEFTHKNTSFLFLGDCKKRLKISKEGISSRKDRQYNVQKIKRAIKKKMSRKHYTENED